MEWISFFKGVGVGILIGGVAIFFVVRNNIAWITNVVSTIYTKIKNDEAAVSAVGKAVGTAASTVTKSV